MASGERPQDSLVAAKIALPSVTDTLVARRRLETALAALLEQHRVVGVWATAGAGKTTAVRQGVMALGWPVAWLTLDSSDIAPGRFLAYLRASSARAFTDRRSDEFVLNTQISHFEAAALVAQSLPRARAVVVLDELERIADSPPALEVLSGFLRYLHPEIRVVLIGRREVELDAFSRLGFGAVGHLGEAQLAFNAEEAASALQLHGLDHAHAERVVEATGGWVMGVLFEAWKSHEHVGGSGGETDPLAGYLGAEILDSLDAEEREFLVRTSLFEEVTCARAEALGEAGAQRLLKQLRDRHLPVTWRDGGAAMRYHPRFREYLSSLLDRRDVGLTAGLRHAYGLALAREGQHEAALDVLLSIGYVTDALEAAEPALAAAMRRLDLDLAQSWLDQFAAAGLDRVDFLLAAQLTIAVARENFHQAVQAADRLRSIGALTSAQASGREHAALAAWSYWHVGRIDDARAMLESTPVGYEQDVIRYVLSLVSDGPPNSLPQLAGGPLDALIQRVSFARGRLQDVLRAPVSPWIPAASERASAFRAIGDLEKTRMMLSEAPGVLANLRFEGMVGVELLVDLRQEQGAREALVKARKRIHESGSIVLDTVSRIIAAKLELRIRGDGRTALAILGGIETSEEIISYRYLCELTGTWTGFALLLEDRDAEALSRLREVVAAMVLADRILELPTAAIYLAEAEARAGDDEASAAAADLALSTATRHGSRYGLFQALDDFPSVAARQIEFEHDPDGSWHEIGRSLSMRGRVRVLSPSPLLYMRDLGPPALICAGEERRPRIAKSYALLAYLLENNGHATRPELLEALFDARHDDSTSAYLRQAAQTLRASFPPGVELLREADAFVLHGAERIETDTIRLRARLASALALIGESQLLAARAVLDEHRNAVYLPGINCGWVERRRSEVAATLISARIDTAVAAMQISRYAIAAELLAETVEADPLREQAWRLLMRVSAAQGLDDHVVEAYRRCESALAEVGLTPTSSTKLLIEGLRR